MRNLLEAPMFKIADRRALCERVHGALLASDDCRYAFRGEWKPFSTDELGNWLAREHFMAAKQDYPASTLPVDLPLEPLSAE